MFTLFLSEAAARFSPHVFDSTLRSNGNGQVAIFVCLLLCIRLVGGFNGNTDKTLCWSAVCAASVVLGCHCMSTELLLRTADLPTKTTWENGKGEPATLSTTGGDMQLSQEVRWATTGRVAAPSIAFDGGLRLYQGGDH